jgi:uncharacterized protein YdiU (UPF0061 family)
MRFYDRFVTSLPPSVYSRVLPTPVTEPAVKIYSSSLVADLGLTTPLDAAIFTGGKILTSMAPFAARYGGHQFGSWAGQLGDGRAITLGELLDSKGVLHEIQLKGSGLTPYSRQGDGKAVLRSSIREFLASEAMHYLGVPTTRALALCTTGESAIRDPMYQGVNVSEPTAIVTRVAPTFLRFGSFEILADDGDVPSLKTLTQFCIENFYSQIAKQYGSNLSGQHVLTLFKEIAEGTIRLVLEWIRVGFIHAVMNTDNMSIIGLTIDYGPYAFIEEFIPLYTPNLIDYQNQRYGFLRQPSIALWNLLRLGGSFFPLLNEMEQSQLITYFGELEELTNKEVLTLFLRKFNLRATSEGEKVVESGLRLLEHYRGDYTAFFYLLTDSKFSNRDILLEAFPFWGAKDELKKAITSWLEEYERTPKEVNYKVNPTFIMKNFMLEAAIKKALQNDFSLVEELYHASMNPYEEPSGIFAKWPFGLRPSGVRDGILSCSS